MCGTPLPFSCPLQAPRPQATQVTHSPLRFAAALSRCVLLCDFLPAWWMDTVVECVPNTCLGALQRCDAVCVGAPPPGYPPAGYPGYPPAGYPAPGPAPGVCSAACLRWGGGSLCGCFASPPGVTVSGSVCGSGCPRMLSVCLLCPMHAVLAFCVCSQGTGTRPPLHQGTLPLVPTVRPQVLCPSHALPHATLSLCHG